MIIVIQFLITAVITIPALWVGMKLTAIFIGMGKGAVYCSFWQIAVVSVVSAVVALIPTIGEVASFAIFYYLLWKFTEAGVMELVMMVLFSKIVSILAVMYLMLTIGTLLQ